MLAADFELFHEFEFGEGRGVDRINFSTPTPSLTLRTVMVRWMPAPLTLSTRPRIPEYALEFAFGGLFLNFLVDATRIRPGTWSGVSA